MSNEPEKLDRFVLVKKASFMKGKGYYLRRVPRTVAPNQMKQRLRFSLAAQKKLGSRAVDGRHPVSEAIKEECSGPIVKEEEMKRALTAVQYYHLIEEMARKGVEEVLLPKDLTAPVSVPSTASETRQGTTAESQSP